MQKEFMWAGGKRIAKTEVLLKEHSLNVELGTAAREIWKKIHQGTCSMEDNPPALPKKCEQGTQDCIGLFLRLRKNLRALVVVHATWYVKAFLALVRPFIRYWFKA